MTVYHGTTLDVYKKIKEEGKIKATTPENSPYANGGVKTTPGYVYLTSKIKGDGGAIDFANRNFIRRFLQPDLKLGAYNKELPRKLVVIKLEIDKNLLENDADELLYGDQSGENCFRYKGDITIKNEKVLKFKFDNYDECYSIKLKIINSMKWESIL